MAETRKARIATASLAGCFGCHMALLDIDERLIGLMQLVEFDRSPLNDIKKFTQRCDVGIIEGGCCNEENVHVLQNSAGTATCSSPSANAPSWAGCRSCATP